MLFFLFFPEGTKMLLQLRGRQQVLPCAADVTGQLALVQDEEEEEKSESGDFAQAFCGVGECECDADHREIGVAVGGRGPFLEIERDEAGVGEKCDEENGEGGEEDRRYLHEADLERRGHVFEVVARYPG